MIKLRLTDAAALSIVEQADYYRHAADQSVAVRWESAVDDALLSLLKFPERGAPCRFRSTLLAGLRWIPIRGFERRMVFYRYEVDVESIVVVQVIYGARDLETLLTQ